MKSALLHLLLFLIWALPAVAAEIEGSVVVAVVDTGIDPDHPALKNHLWHKEGSGEYGFDFISNQKNPLDKVGHGTHIAGIISSSAPNVKIMVLRCLDPQDEQASLIHCARAFDYAISNGAKVINFSAGGNESYAVEKQMIQKAAAKKILFVTAAGNFGQNTDLPGQHFYPANYDLDNIVSVAATNQAGLLTSSNWGKESIHVAAPGENVYSTFLKGAFHHLTGTSQAAAYTTAVAALVLGANPYLQPNEVRKVLIDSSDRLPELQNKVRANGTINAVSAVKRAQDKLTQMTMQLVARANINLQIR